MLVELVPSDHIRKVNAGEAKFADYYREPAEKLLKLLEYGEDGPMAYSYEDACTAFARGQSAMFPVRLVRRAASTRFSANPEMNIGLFAVARLRRPRRPHRGLRRRPVLEHGRGQRGPSRAELPR